jgi:polar amino acid transport system substrate-binding protein
VGDPIKSEDFGFIFTPGSDLVAPFNVAIETLRADGTFEALDNKWFFEYDPNAE